MLLKNLEKSERAVEGADLVFSSNEKQIRFGRQGL